MVSENNQSETEARDEYRGLHESDSPEDVSEYPLPVEQQEPLDEVIKVRWNQSGASHTRMVRSLTASFEDANEDEPLIGVGVRALTRQKTNVVVRTVQEAESLLYELDEYLHPYGLNVPEGAGTRAFERVRDELETELEAQGYTVERQDVGRPDVSREREGDGEPMTDGGEDLETLANAAGDAIASSDIPLNRISVSVGEIESEVTVQPNGHISREDWTELRDAITRALDAAGIQHTAKPQWAFVRVDGREIRTDGGSVDSREPSGVSNQDRHTDVKQRAIALDCVMMVKTAGERGEFVAVYRREDAALDEYHTLMDLAGYRSVDPYQVLTDHPGGITADDIRMDLWERVASTDGGVVQPDARGEDTPTALAMDAVYAAVGGSVCGGPVTVVPSAVSERCSVRYSGEIGELLREELDALGLEMLHGPDGSEDVSGTIRVTGFSDGGDGGE